MITHLPRTGEPETPSERRHFCAGCQEWVASIEGHRSGKGSTPLCGRCSVRVTCDCCRREVPFGLCEVDANDVVICVECGGDVPSGCSIPRDEADCGGRGQCAHRNYDALMAGVRDTRVGHELRGVLGPEVSP